MRSQGTAYVRGNRIGQKELSVPRAFRSRFQRHLFHSGTIRPSRIAPYLFLRAWGAMPQGQRSHRRYVRPDDRRSATVRDGGCDICSADARAGLLVQSAASKNCCRGGGSCRFGSEAVRSVWSACGTCDGGACEEPVGCSSCWGCHCGRRRKSPGRYWPSTYIQNAAHQG